MDIVLLSGGTGKRLWPLSNGECPKQFLEILPDGNGGFESMAQRTLRKIRDCSVSANIYVVCCEEQFPYIRSQLGESVEAILEPSARDSFPAIAFSCLYLSQVKGLKGDDSIIFMPIDAFVDEEYYQIFESLEGAVNSNESDIVLIGKKPTFPSTDYGYIVVDKSIDYIKKVRMFKEKPCINDAMLLVENGALWNCGVFAFKINYVLNILKDCFAIDDYDKVKNDYSMLKKISFDHAVLEKANSVAVLEYDGEWVDIGNWKSLTQVCGDFLIGNVVKDDDSVNTSIINHLSIPIIVLGAEDMNIVATSHGVLVCQKSKSSEIKEYINKGDAGV